MSLSKEARAPDIVTGSLIVGQLSPVRALGCVDVPNVSHATDGETTSLLLSCLRRALVSEQDSN